MLEALGDATRRRIVERLRPGPLPVGELARGLPVGRPAVSKHLRVLEEAGLVEHRSVGTRNLYALAPPGVTALQQWLVRTRDEALATYAARVAARATTGRTTDDDHTPAPAAPGPPTGGRPGAG